MLYIQKTDIPTQNHQNIQNMKKKELRKLRKRPSLLCLVWFDMIWTCQEKVF